MKSKLEIQDLHPFTNIIAPNELKDTINYLSDAIYLLHYLEEDTTPRNKLLNVCCIINNIKEGFSLIEKNIEEKNISSV